MTQTLWFYFTTGFLSCWFLIGAVILILDAVNHKFECDIRGVMYGALTALAIPAAILIALGIRAYLELSGYIRRKIAERKIY